MSKVRKNIIGLFILFLCACSNSTISKAGSGDDVTFYLNLLSHRQTGQSMEQYDAVREFVLTGIVDKKSFKFAPIKRSRQSFLNDLDSCLFPTNLRAVEERAKDRDLKFISTIPFDIVSFRLYTVQENLKHSSINDFKPSRVGYIRGTAALPLLNKNSASFMPISSEKQPLNLWGKGRNLDHSKNFA